jgi:DNA polymerase I-like protein with 3'-5' exonuclease and polymerase domains
VRGGPKGDSPEAHWPSNECLMVGWRYLNETTMELSEKKTGTLEDLKEELDSDEIGGFGYNIEKVVAHNAKFDLKWLIREGTVVTMEPYADWHIHCTMTAEYLYTGQAEKFITLENLATKHGILAKKTMDLESYIESGGKMEDIPSSKLREYLETDVELVTLIYLAQCDKWDGCKKYDMRYIWPLSEMELNGLPVDRLKCEKLAEQSTRYCDRVVGRIKEYIKHTCEWRDGDPITDADFEKKIKPTANRTLSFVLTGFPEKVRTTSDKWTYGWKPGSHGPFLTPGSVKAVYGKTKPTNLGYPMDEAHLEKILKLLPRGSWPQLLPKWRKQDKLLNTYYLPFLVKSKETGCLHPKLNTTATATGRLSSSDPNGQNMPSEARTLITAPADHSVCELDFSQLELVALANICRDKQMLEDINAGEDIHFNSGQTVFGWRHPTDMTKDDRKIVKNVNFGAVYGGKAPGLSYQTGVDKKIVQKLINSLYSRYPGIGTWQREFYEEVVENMEPNGHDDKGEQLYKSSVRCGGRDYTFFETPSPKWLRARMGRGYSFNPNQVYNYPIQGFAGWQIVLQYLYKLWRISETNWKFIMTVHDSIVILVPDDEVSVLESRIENAAENLVKELKLPVPLSVDVDTGYTWS